MNHNTRAQQAALEEQLLEALGSAIETRGGKSLSRLEPGTFDQLFCGVENGILHLDFSEAGALARLHANGDVHLPRDRVGRQQRIENGMVKAVVLQRLAEPREAGIEQALEIRLAETKTEGARGSLRRGRLRHTGDAHHIDEQIGLDDEVETHAARNFGGLRANVGKPAGAVELAKTLADIFGIERLPGLHGERGRIFFEHARGLADDAHRHHSRASRRRLRDRGGRRCAAQQKNGQHRCAGVSRSNHVRPNRKEG